VALTACRTLHDRRAQSCSQWHSIQDECLLMARHHAPRRPQRGDVGPPAGLPSAWCGGVGCGNGRRWGATAVLWGR
jgi:hypothetical protein